MPAFCVGRICTSIDRVPSDEDLDAARREDEKLGPSRMTTLALTAPHQVGPFTRRAALRPGESPAR